MIHFLRGKLLETLPTQIIVDVGGVGYEVLIPLSSFDKLPARGNDITILTHLAIREDAHVLYGFMSAAERDMFRLLINTVSGIGPKIALNILSGINISALRNAVATGDVKSLSQISGVGKKTAERIIIELRDKIQGLAATSTASMPGDGVRPVGAASEAAHALAALGYRPQEASRMVQGVAKPDMTAEDIIRLALRSTVTS